MTRSRKIAAGILLFLLLCNLCFIWGNSLASKDSSHNMSMNVLDVLPAFIQQLFSNVEQLEHIVRKLAHFSEFACLGGLGCGLLIVFRKVSLHPVVHLLSGGLLAASIDETIQIFSHRGSQLQDVWLDFSGFLVGTGIVLGIYALGHFLGKQTDQHSPAA